LHFRRRRARSAACPNDLETRRHAPARLPIASAPRPRNCARSPGIAAAAGGAASVPERAPMVDRLGRTRPSVAQCQMRVSRWRCAAASLPRRGARVEDAPIRCCRSPEVHKLRRATVSAARSEAQQAGGDPSACREGTSALVVPLCGGRHACFLGCCSMHSVFAYNINCGFFR